MSAICFALAVSTKVIPLILLPLIVRKTGLRAGTAFSALAAVVCIVLFLPFIDPTLLRHLAVRYAQAATNLIVTGRERLDMVNLRMMRWLVSRSALFLTFFSCIFAQRGRWWPGKHAVLGGSRLL